MEILLLNVFKDKLGEKLNISTADSAWGQKNLSPSCIEQMIFGNAVLAYKLSHPSVFY